MDDAPLKVWMLGEFSITMGDARIDDSGNRSRKVWLLLAYMIYNRNRPVTQEELIGLLWGEDTGSTNPVNALKTMLHRVRTMLNQLDPTAGHSLIVRRGGSYAWNNEYAVELDVERFDELSRQSLPEDDEEGQLALMLETLELYRGDFLSKLSNEPWVVPIAAYFHNIYVQILLAALPLLERREQWPRVVELCRSALVVEPYNEVIYQHLMRALLETGRQQEAVQAYEEMSELLFSNFGIMPSDESRALYREALRTINDHAIPMGLVQEQLREQDSLPGALICDYDFFKVLYQAEARSVARSGDAVHIGLLSLVGADGKSLPKRSLNHAMDNLQDQIRINLRRGDIAAQCSVSQFILMLPQANYENSCMVCQRIRKAFMRQYPHSPVEIHISVHPLEPNL